MWDTETSEGAKEQYDKETRTALKELEGLKDEVFLPADKGNATVMMRKCL